MEAKTDPSSEEPNEPPEVRRGRRQGLAIGVTLAGSIVIVAFLGGSSMPGMFVQLIVLLLLGVQISRGTGWARWVTVAMTVLAGVGNAYQGVISFGADGIGWGVNVGLAIIYLWCAVVLGLSSSLTAYMSAQRAERDRQTE